MRWGDKGHIRLDVNSGMWKDFYTDDTGGVLDMLERELGLDRRGSMKWLNTEGLIPETEDRRPVQEHVERPVESVADVVESIPGVSAVPTGAATSGRGAELVNAALSESFPVPDNPNHPARLWAAKHHAWRSDLPFPKGARWLPERASFFRSMHQGAGSIIILAAPLSRWQTSYPLPPKPTAIQLIAIDAHGNPALDRPEDYKNSRGEQKPGIEKRTHGVVRDAVYCIGDPRPRMSEHTAVCEGLKDAMCLTARLPLTAIAFLGVPTRANARVLARYKRVDIYPDIDESGERWAHLLAAATAAYGATTQICTVSPGSDPGDAGVLLPQGDPDIQSSKAAAYKDRAYEEHDAQRLAWADAQIAELKISSGKGRPDGIYAARKVVVEPEPALIAAIRIREVIKRLKGSLSAEEGNAIIADLSVIEAASGRPFENNERVDFFGLERSLLDGEAIDGDTMRLLSGKTRESMTVSLSSFDGPVIKWLIDNFWPEGSLVGLTVTDEDKAVDIALRLLLAAARVSDDEHRFALACHTIRPSWAALRLSEVRAALDAEDEAEYEDATQKVLYAPITGTSGLWRDGTFTQQARKLLGLCISHDVRALAIDGAFDSCTSGKSEDIRAFCAAMRNWCDSTNRSVLLVTKNSYQDMEGCQISYGASSDSENTIRYTRKRGVLPTLSHIDIMANGSVR